MQDKKIAYILSRFPVFTETFVMREIEELRRMGITVEVFSLKNPNSKEILHNKNIELIKTTHYPPYFFSLPLWKSVFFYLGTQPITCLYILTTIFITHIKNPIQLLKSLVIIPKVFLIAAILRKTGIKKIHSHWATIPTTAAWIISKLNDCTYTFTAHAWDIYQVGAMLKEKLRDASNIITISNYNKRYLIDKFPTINPNKIKVVHCGLDLKKFIPQKSDKGNMFKILSIGRLTEKKGFDVLLKACKLLNKKNIHFRCQIIYVSGDFEKKIFNLYEKLHLSDYVEFIAEIPQERIIEYYSNADCFVLPCVIAGNNDRDGIPVVILEALAMELPVVATPVSGIPEVIKDNKTGLLVSPKNAEELANAIERIHSDTAFRENLGKAGREFVHEQFELTSSVNRLITTIFN